jgi:hypothetical protein
LDYVRALWQRRFVRVGAVALIAVALLFLAVSYYVPMRPTDSVSVTARYYSYESPPERQIFATVIHDSVTARRVLEIFNAARGPIQPSRGAMCALPADPIYTYDFEFTWRGLTSESVYWALLNCSEIHVMRWGNPFSQWYAGLSQNQYDELARLTGIPTNPRY